MMALAAGSLAIATGLLLAASSSITFSPTLAVADPVDALLAEDCGSRKRARLANAAVELRYVVGQLRGVAGGSSSYEQRRSELAHVEVALSRCGSP